jgi:hypothetical protein
MVDLLKYLTGIQQMHGNTLCIYYSCASNVYFLFLPLLAGNESKNSEDRNQARRERDRA